MDVADPDQAKDVWLVGMVVEWSDEEEDGLHGALCDARSDLAVSAERPGEKLVHFEGWARLFHTRAGGSGRTERKAREEGLVPTAKILHFLLFAVVRDQCDHLRALKNGR